LFLLGKKRHFDGIAFLEQFKNNVDSFNADVFLSSQIIAYVIFYKYYLTGQELTRASDFGGIFHLHAMPIANLWWLNEMYAKSSTRSRKDIDSQ
jgi:hypothetical protein